MLGSGSTLGYSKNNRQLHSFRCHFEVPSNADAPAMNSYVIDFGDGTTSLSEKLRVKSEEFATAAEWYSLDGRKLDGEPTKKGQYIVNGRKVVVK